jgi:hypothetical protein
MRELRKQELHKRIVQDPKARIPLKADQVHEGWSCFVYSGRDRSEDGDDLHRLVYMRATTAANTVARTPAPTTLTCPAPLAAVTEGSALRMAVVVIDAAGVVAAGVVSVGRGVVVGVITAGVVTVALADSDPDGVVRTRDVASPEVVPAAPPDTVRVPTLWPPALHAWAYSMQRDQLQGIIKRRNGTHE